MAKLSRILEAHNYVIIKFAHDHCKNISSNLQKKMCLCFSPSADQDHSTRQNKTHIFGIITSIDLLDFIVKHNKSGEASNSETVKQNGFHPEDKLKTIRIAKESEALH